MPVYLKVGATLGNSYGAGGPESADRSGGTSSQSPWSSQELLNSVDLDAEPGTGLPQSSRLGGSASGY